MMMTEHNSTDGSKPDFQNARGTRGIQSNTVYSKLETRNILAGKPVRGTILHVLEPELFDSFNEATDLYEALQKNPTLFDKATTLTIIKANRDMWISIFAILKMPYAWPVGVDVVTREVYITE